MNVSLFGASWDPSHTFLVTGTLGPLPYPPAIAAVNVAPWNDTTAAASQSIIALKAALDTFSAAIQANETYLAKANAFYSDYVAAHGAITSILAANRVKAIDMGILTQGVSDAKAIFNRAIAQIENLMTVKATSNLPDPTTSQTSPGSSGVLTKTPATVSPKQSWAMPAALAAVAAYFALK